MRLLILMLLCSIMVSCKKSKPTVIVFKNESLPKYEMGKAIIQTGSNLAPIIMFPGQGYNSVTGERMDAVLVDTPLVTVLKSSAEKFGQHVELSFDLVESFEQLRKSLSVDVTASLKMGVFKGRNELSTLESASFNSYSTFFLVSLRVTNPSLSLKPQAWRLTDKARNLLNDSANFTRSFGDEFVTSIETGGSLYILLQYKTDSREEKKDLRNTLNASVKSLFGRAEINATIQSKFEQIQYSKSQNVYFSGTGICDSIPSLDLPNLINYIKSFPDRVSLNQGCPSVLDITTQKINSLADITNRDMFDAFIKQRDFLEDCVYKKDSLLRIKGDIKYIQDNKDEFSNLNEDELSKNESVVDNSLQGLNRLVNHCAANMRFCDISLIKEIIVPKVKTDWSKGDITEARAFKDIQIDNLKIGKPLLLDSIGSRLIKTFELRGIYGFTYWGALNEYVYNDPSQGYTFKFIPSGELQMETTVSLTLKIVDRSGAVVERLQYNNKPIEISRKDVFVYLQPTVSNAFVTEADFIRGEESLAARGVKQFIVKPEQPLHVLIY